MNILLTANLYFSAEKVRSHLNSMLFPSQESLLIPKATAEISHLGWQPHANLPFLYDHLASKGSPTLTKQCYGPLSIDRIPDV